MVVYQSLCYVAEIMPAIGDRVTDGMPPQELARNLLSNMRTSLSVPAMFAAVRIMRRLQGFLKTAATAFDSGEFIFELPKPKKSHVNHTVACIFRALVDRLFSNFESRLETAQRDFNPYRDISTALDQIIAYVAKKQFGIVIK